MAGKPHVEDDSLEKIPLSYRDYEGKVEPSEPVEISVAHLDSIPVAAKVTAAQDHAAKSAKKEN